MLTHLAFFALDCQPMHMYTFGTFWLDFKVFHSQEGFFLEAVNHMMLLYKWQNMLD